MSDDYVTVCPCCRARFLVAKAGERVDLFAKRLIAMADRDETACVGEHNGRLMIANEGATVEGLLAQWDAHHPREPRK